MITTGRLFRKFSDERGNPKYIIMVYPYQRPDRYFRPVNSESYGTHNIY